MQIGVFGATGHVGRGTLKVLDGQTFQVIAYYHTLEKAEEMKKCFSDKICFKQLDLNEESAIENACDECDILVNCAGPSGEIMERIANVSMQQGKLYIDVAGGKFLKEKIEKLYNIHGNGGCILGAGIYPGLTEIFATAIAEKYSAIRELHLYFHGNSELSEVATYDIVDGMEKAEGGMSYLHHGEVTRLLGNPSSKRSVKPPFDQLVTMPILGDEFCEMVRGTGIVDAYFYHSFKNEQALMDFIMIKAMQKYKTVEEKKESARKVQSILYNPNEPINVVLLAEYIYGEENKKGYARFWSNEDWNLITGYVAGLVATQLAEKGCHLKGVFYPAGVIETEELLEQLGMFCKIEISHHE